MFRELSLIILAVVMVQAVIHPPSTPRAFQGRDAGNGGEGVVYVAAVIHMNQLLEDIHKTNIYGHLAYDVFNTESRIPLTVPGAKLVVDITGPTLASLMATAPDIIGNFRKGVENGSVEILGVTYGQIPVQYLPYSHVEKHVRLMEKIVWNLFHVKPRGLWQEDRQWTPELPYIIGKLGYEYTLIDDNVYRRGNPDSDKYSVYYPHIASYNGSSIIIFHISEYMRYHFRDTASVKDIINYLGDILNHTKNNPIPPIIVYGDDAEFGLNPEVFRRLARIPWIRFTTLSEYIDKYREYLTPANYNVTGAYREYEYMFGRDWYKWYSSPTARRLTAEFNQAEEWIRRAEETGRGWLAEAAWTYLLLAEWQYGPFYKTGQNSNREYLVDSILYSALALLNETGCIEERIIGHRIGAYRIGDWGMGLDYTRNTIRVLVNYRYKTINTPPMFFNTGKWWVFTPPGTVLENAELINGVVSNGRLVINTRTGKIIVEAVNDSLTIKSNKTLILDARIVPGNIIRYMEEGFPEYYYNVSGGEVRLADQEGYTLILNNTSITSKPIDEGFAVHLPHVESREMQVGIGVNTAEGLRPVPTQTATVPASPRTGRGGSLVILLLILVLALLGIIAAILLSRGKLMTV